MKAKLEEFLNSVGAKFASPDDRFTEAAAAAKLKRFREKVLPQLETQHANFLKPDFRPNQDWWGSAPKPK
jgi:hypothetical protein